MISHKNQKKQFWVIILIVFLGFLGISIPYLIFPALFLNPSYSILPSDWEEPSRALYLGLTLAVYPFGQFIGSPILGSLSDDYGRKKLLSASLVITAVCNLITGFAIAKHHLALLILSRFLAGLMEGNIAIARAMAADLTEISKHSSFGKINAAASIAYLVGPLLGGLLTDKNLFQELTASTPFYLVCLLFFGISGLSYIVLDNSEKKNKEPHRNVWQRINITKRLKDLLKHKRLTFLLITSTCFTLAVDIFYEFGPVYLTVKWSLDPAQLIIYNGVLCIALAIGNGWLPAFLSTRVKKPAAIIFSLGSFAVFLILMITTNSSLLMLILFTLSGLIIGLAVTFITVKISDSASDQIQGEVMGVQISLRVLGDAIICLLGGVLLLLSSKLILIFAAIISLGAMIYYSSYR